MASFSTFIAELNPAADGAGRRRVGNLTPLRQAQGRLTLRVSPSPSGEGLGVASGEPGQGVR